MPDAALNSPQRVLIVKPTALGDVVTAMPVLRGLRRSFPQCHITWLIAPSCIDLIRHDSDLNDTILFDRKALGRLNRVGLQAVQRLRAVLRNARFDWVIDLQGLLRSGLMTWATRAKVRAGFASAREGAAAFYTHRVRVSAQHTVDANIELARSLHIDASPADFTLQVAPAAAAFAEGVLERLGLRRKEFLVCVPPTRWPTKVYPARHWRVLAGELARQMPVLMLGGPGDVALCAAASEGLSAVHNLAGQTNVAQMVAMIAAARGVICSDSAAKFIAPAVGTNALALLGPTRVERTGVYVPGPHVQAVNVVAPVPCQGCLRRRCSHETCMQAIRPQDVLAAAGKLFSL